MGKDVGVQESLERRVVPRITGVDVLAEKFVCAAALLAAQCGPPPETNKKQQRMPQRHVVARLERLSVGAGPSRRECVPGHVVG